MFIGRFRFIDRAIRLSLIRGRLLSLLQPVMLQCYRPKLKPESWNYVLSEFVSFLEGEPGIALMR